MKIGEGRMVSGSLSSLFISHHSPIVIAVSYIALTVAMMWPLAAGIASDVPADLGDPLLNMWILDWMATGIVRVVSGSMSATDVWNANIFHPEPLTLTFSEHLFGQALLMLPAYLVTNNLILCYNLLFMASFVLSGLGMYLLVRDLTGRVDAAFLAGIVFAFVPLRMAQFPHIQVLSTQWMPLALFGFRRFITTARWPSLAGGTAALLINNWSCGYYLLFFAPFVPLFVVHQMLVHGRTRDIRMWVAFGAAAALVAAGTWPFLTYYLEAQRVHGFERPYAEVIRYSADVYGYLTAPEMLRIWGRVLRATPKGEGEVFLGFSAMLLGLIGIVTTVSGAWRGTGSSGSTRGRRLAARIIGVVGLAQLVALFTVVLTGGFVTSVLGLPIRATNGGRLFAHLTLLAVGLLAVSPRARGILAVLARSQVAWAVAAMLLAMWLSLGPRPTTRGVPLEGFGLYGLLYEYVPGFTGLRVPARYAMIAALFLAIVAGAGAAAIAARFARGTGIVGVAMLACLAEGFVAPIPRNTTWATVAPLRPARMYPADDAPRVYHAVASLPPDTVIAEFPFGHSAWELRYMFYASVHHYRLLNGYSGYFPRGYQQRVARFARLAEAPEPAWEALVEAGTTHVVLHRAAIPDQTDTIAGWLNSHGARLLGTFDGEDELYALPQVRLPQVR